MDEHITLAVLKATGARRILHTAHIQELWSGYGEIMRCQLSGGQVDTVVVKHVRLPASFRHPRGWHTDLSHQRKLKSYHVEMQWYKHQAQRCDDDCRIPQVLHCDDHETEMLMIMEDLDRAGYPVRKSNVDQIEIASCLKWLAHFHAKFIGDPSGTDDGLWPVGTYWHLETRPEEWKKMQDEAMQSAAGKIDETLNQAQYQTLVHGDAKLANFCFAEDGKKVAAVDFQYVGRGCGMKDVAYLLSSCLHEEALMRSESSLLSYYFKALKAALAAEGSPLDFEAIQAEWSRLYNYAWADFYRFLDGWSPGHWKIHTYSLEIRNKVLQQLSENV